MRQSAVIPAHVATRTVVRTKGFTRRAVYSHGRLAGYVTSHLRAHTALTVDGQQIPNGEMPLFEYLSNAVVAVADAAK